MGVKNTAYNSTMKCFCSVIILTNLLQMHSKQCGYGGLVPVRYQSIME